MAKLLSDLIFSAVGASGGLNAATLTFYATGTTTPQAIYSESTLTTEHPNPVCADSSGRFPAIWLSDNTDYKAVLKDSAGVTLDTVDPVSGREVGLDLANVFTKTQVWAKGADVASAAALTLGTDGNSFDITGTTAITSIGTLGVGTWVKLHFDGALTLTHNATDLVLPNSENITTAAGDIAILYEYATGDWRLSSYLRAAGSLDANQVNPLPPGFIKGLAISNGTDADHDLDIASGQARSDDDTTNLVESTGQTKQIDASWATGTNAGGLSSSVALANDMTLHVIMGLIGSTIEFGFDTSITGANLVTDHSFTKPTLIFSFVLDGSQNIIPFFDRGYGRVDYDAQQADVAASNPGDTAQTRDLTVPTGIEVIARLVAGHVDTSASSSSTSLVTALDQTDSAAASTANFTSSITANGGVGATDFSYAEIKTNTSGQIRSRMSGSVAGVTQRIHTIGFVHTKRRVP